jgi:hypothetical protein
MSWKNLTNRVEEAMNVFRVTEMYDERQGRLSETALLEGWSSCRSRPVTHTDAS